jgi:hypothetical protein
VAGGRATAWRIVRRGFSVRSGFCLVEWARTSMLSTEPPLASPDDMSIPQCVTSGDEAIAVLGEHRARWLRRSTG